MTGSAPAPLDRLGTAIAWTFGSLLVFSLWAVSCGWTHNLLDAHGFRQTQTAISTYYLLKGSSVLAYETPVLGPPWSIPFEFPLYQWLVALAVAVLDLNIESAGRLVSVSFFYLSFISIFSVLGVLHIGRNQRLIVLSFILSSPLYLFWSRTFMIESAALFLSVTFLALFMRVFERWSPLAGFSALLIGCLGGMVKITTFYGFAAAAAAFAACTMWRDRTITVRRVACAGCLLGVPVLATMMWTSFADAHKALNPFAGFVRSAALHRWTFGTLEQRFALDPTWSVITVRAIWDASGSPGVYATLASILWSKRYFAHYSICIGVYLVAMLTFANLHVVHEYYAYATGIFIIAAQGFAICSLLEGSRRQQIVGTTMMFVLIALSLRAYLTGQNQIQQAENPGIVRFAGRIEELSRPEDVLLVYGFDWSPELPYYAKRRALMVRVPGELSPDIVAAARRRIVEQGFGVGPLIACRLSEPTLRVQLELWGLNPSTRVDVGGCAVYFANPTRFGAVPSSV